MTRLACALLACLAASSALAADRFVLPAPDRSRISVQRGLPFRATPALQFDLYRPASQDVVPLVIVGNAGSMQYGTWAGYIGWGETFAAAGLGLVIYQSTQQTVREDFEALLGVLRQRAGELRIDPSRIVLWSGSANVTFALPAAMEPNRPYLKGLIAYYGDGKVSGIRTDLPVLLVRAGLDGTWLNQEIDKLIVRALAANAPWTIVNHASGYHGFDVLNHDEVSREVVRETVAFAQKALRPDVSASYAQLAADAATGGAFARGEWATAAEGYRAKVAAAPEDAEANRRLGLSLVGVGKPAEGLTALERAYDLGRKGTRDTVLPAAQAAGRAGNAERAVYWLGRALGSQFAPPFEELMKDGAFARVEKDPAFVKLVAGHKAQQRVQALFDEGKSADALRLLRGSEPRFADEVAVQAIAYRLLNGGKHADAIAVFELNIERHPKSANAWDDLGAAFERAGERAKAVEASRKALELLPGDASLNEQAKTGVRNASGGRVERLTTKS